MVQPGPEVQGRSGCQDFDAGLHPGPDHLREASGQWLPFALLLQRWGQGQNLQRTEVSPTLWDLDLSPGRQQWSW